ncbi:MAG: cupredoxin domain-containing protein [Actinobacteria bacterium]|nr:cupredoxin domain-containing protein [Actinomycetota bacterium]
MRSDLRERFLLPIGIPVLALAFIGAVVFGLSRILLAVTPTGAVLVGVVVAGSLLAVAALVAGGRVGTGQLAAMVVSVAGVALIAGGVVSATITEEEDHGGNGGGGGPPPVAVAAPPGAAVDGFAQTELAAPAGAPFTIAFDNQDPQIQHNVAIYSADPIDDPQAEELFMGEIVAGPVRVDYDVPALESGDYFFRCDVHPTTMTGTLTVQEGGGGGGGGGGPADASLVAEAIAFDLSEIALPADTEVRVRLDNRDAGVPHNFAMYTEQGGEAVFQGEIFNGVAEMTYSFEAPDPGTYYFQCDVHPNMNGTVKVE